MFKHLLGLFFVCCFLSDAGAQTIKLRKLKPAKRHAAVYNCGINEFYRIEQGADTAKETEWIKTFVNIEIQQDILERKRKYMQEDYRIEKFVRSDSVKKANGNVDTVSNHGKIPLIKIILQHDRKGKFLGPTIELYSQMQQQRDFKYMYNRSKGLIFNMDYLYHALGDSILTRTDTVFHTGFDMVINYKLAVKLNGSKDTLGMRCFVLNYSSQNSSFTGSDNMMKALGLEAIHNGAAFISGRLLVDAKTGRLISFNEFGTFDGTVQMKTPGEEFNWPTRYTYRRTMTLDRIIKKPRKKIWGIF